jgi:transcriptional regulator with XRE-family HTH domain
MGRPKKGSEEERRIHERDAEIRRLHRKGKGLSKSELARDFRLTRQHVQKILRGK